MKRASFRTGDPGISGIETALDRSGGWSVERCLACEADGERSDITRNGPVTQLRSTFFEEVDSQNPEAMLQSVEIERDVARGFPLLTIGLASEAALHGYVRKTGFRRWSRLN